jgi:hypothetical protein
MGCNGSAFPRAMVEGCRWIAGAQEEMVSQVVLTKKVQRRPRSPYIAVCASDEEWQVSAVTGKLNEEESCEARVVLGSRGQWDGRRGRVAGRAALSWDVPCDVLRRFREFVAATGCGGIWGGRATGRAAREADGVGTG